MGHGESTGGGKRHDPRGGAQAVLFDAVIDDALPRAGTVPVDKRTSETIVAYDAVVSNPPYQLATSGTSDRPIYLEIMDLAYAVAGIASLVTPARFLFDAGKTPKAWNRRMLSDPCLSVSLYEPDAQSVFPGTEIMGGVAVTTRDASNPGEPIGNFCPIPELDSIRRKVWATEAGGRSMYDIMFAQGRLDLARLLAEHPECRDAIGSGGRETRLTTSILSKLPIFSETRDAEHNLAVLGIVRGKRTMRHMPGDMVLRTPSTNISEFKVAVPASNGSPPVASGAGVPVIGIPMVLGKESTHTQSFVSFGDFAEEDEARACEAYIRTRLARALLGILKVTQHNHRGTWRLVPLLDFTQESDIDWEAPPNDVDRQLAERYGFDDGERDFLRHAIRPLP